MSPNDSPFIAHLAPAQQHSSRTPQAPYPHTPTKAYPHLPQWLLHEAHELTTCTPETSESPFKDPSKFILDRGRNAEEERQARKKQNQYLLGHNKISGLNLGNGTTEVSNGRLLSNRLHSKISREHTRLEARQNGNCELIQRPTISCFELRPSKFGGY